MVANPVRRGADGAHAADADNPSLVAAPDSGPEDPDEPEPDYRDLLDEAWLERTVDVEDMDEGTPEVDDAALTLDLADDDDEEEDAGQVVEFDVGSLLTLLPAGSGEGEDGALDVDMFGDDLPAPLEGSGDGDEEVGHDERFPVFDESLVAVPGRGEPVLLDDEVMPEELVTLPELRPQKDEGDDAAEEALLDELLESHDDAARDDEAASEDVPPKDELPM